MDINSKIYIAGHRGLIGSAILRKLKSLSYENLVLATHNQLDLTDQKKVEKFFLKNKPEYVFLAAAKVGGIHANKSFPAEFIYQNLMIQSNLIDAAFKNNVKKILFLSSSCVYPKFCKSPIKEEYLFEGSIEPTNEFYGYAKLAGIKMCQAYNNQYKTKFIVAIPSNVYGINDRFDDNGHVLSSLISRFYDAKIKNKDKVVLWGTGKPKRDFLFADDLADACAFLMKNYDGNEHINIGTGKATSILQLSKMVKEIINYPGEVVLDKSKPDGNLNRILDCQRMKSLGFKPSTSLEEGLNITYEWFKKSKINTLQ